MDFKTHGRIILSSLERNADGGQQIHWQRCYGDLDVASSYGEAGDGEEGTDFPGLGPDGSERTAAAGQAGMLAGGVGRGSVWDGVVSAVVLVGVAVVLKN